MWWKWPWKHEWFSEEKHCFHEVFQWFQQIKFRFHICGLKITAAQQYLWLQELYKAQMNTVCDRAPQSQEHLGGWKTSPSPTYHPSCRYHTILTAKPPIIYADMGEVVWNLNLIASFYFFEFIFGAKVIYFSWRFQIWRNFWCARTSARAACAWRWPKSGKLAIFSWFTELSARAARAEVRARQKFLQIWNLHKK